MPTIAPLPADRSAGMPWLAQRSVRCGLTSGTRSHVDTSVASTEVSWSGMIPTML
ncbi:MAG: hypothetical protein AVDCRST_MAG73-3902 [uncultured Thermomicrobiales bacterium]|uniref:Uncharacterized protein n=1 Tax=uncultured Thermomicrobiales bacterium TaxID=1645740 RepID=A0A6J4V2F6_9BACT|nr:MAG: hypothetical protein AVDCRST_MAG73-3902 [uncultured Thermomicrobiales bacterium]